MSKEFEYIVDVTPAAVDANGHANNVEFVRWMQSAAVAHSDTAGCTAATRALGAMWVARSHYIEYRKPAFAGERIRIRTWLDNVRRAFSLRKYVFERVGDDAVLAEAETDWVLVDVQTGRPRSIPVPIQHLFGAAGPEGPAAASAPD